MRPRSLMLCTGLSGLIAAFGPDSARGQVVGPDLSVTGFTASVSAGAVSLAVQICNDGVAPKHAARLTYWSDFAGAAALPAALDVPADAEALGDIPNGSCQTVTGLAAAGIPPGTYTPALCVVWGAADEADLTNNCAQTSYTIGAPSAGGDGLGLATKLGERAALKSGGYVGHLSSVGDATHIGESALIGHAASIGARGRFGDGSTVGDEAVTGQRVKVDKGVWIGDRLRAGDRTKLKRSAIVFDRATLGHHVLIGKDVTIGDEFVAGNKAKIKDMTVVADRAAVRDGAKIGKAVTIGSDATVSAGAKVGNAVDIADGASIGQGAKVKAGASVGADVTIGRAARIGKSVVLGARSVIGDGVVIAAGAQVGDDAVICEPDSDSDCYSGPLGSDGVGICRRGSRRCDASGTALGTCEGEVVPQRERCDGVDNDCDGVVDEACLVVAVNFEPAGYRGPPAGFDIADSGEPYDEGRGYGWKLPDGTPIDVGTSMDLRDVQGSRPHDETLAALALGGGAPERVVWSYKLPPGHGGAEDKYLVTITMVDPRSAISDGCIDVNGQSVVADPNLGEGERVYVISLDNSPPAGEIEVTLGCPGGGETIVNAVEIYRQGSHGEPVAGQLYGWELGPTITSANANLGFVGYAGGTSTTNLTCPPGQIVVGTWVFTTKPGLITRLNDIALRCRSVAEHKAVSYITEGEDTWLWFSGLGLVPPRQAQNDEVIAGIWGRDRLWPNNPKLKSFYLMYHEFDIDPTRLEVDQSTWRELEPDDAPLLGPSGNSFGDCGGASSAAANAPPYGSGHGSDVTEVWAVRGFEVYYDSAQVPGLAVICQQLLRVPLTMTVHLF